MFTTVRISLGRLHRTLSARNIVWVSFIVLLPAFFIGPVTAQQAKSPLERAVEQRRKADHKKEQSQAIQLAVDRAVAASVAAARATRLASQAEEAARIARSTADAARSAADAAKSAADEALAAVRSIDGIGAKSVDKIPRRPTGRSEQ